MYGRTGIPFPTQDIPIVYSLSQVLSTINSKYGGSFSFGIRQPGTTIDDISFDITALNGLNPPRVNVSATYLLNGSSTNISGTLGSSKNTWTVYGTLASNSSKYVKHGIQRMMSVGEKLDKLTPVTFIYDYDTSEKEQMGLIYEDTIEIMPEICIQDEANKAISYVELIPALLKEIQDLRKRVAELERG